MEDKRVKIKYRQGYDPTLNEKLIAVAVALCGEFSDRPLGGDGAREMSFEFRKDEDLRKFFRIFKELLAEKEQHHSKNGEDLNRQEVEQCERAIKEILLLIEHSRDEEHDRRALVKALLGLESRKLKLELMQRLDVALTPGKQTGPDNKPDKRILTEQEAAIFFVRHIRENVRQVWPTIQNNLKDDFQEKFAIEDETMAAFDLCLAAIALDLQAVKNLFPMEQSDRLERWVLKHIGGVEHWGDYAVSEVKEYSSAFQNTMRLGVDIPTGAISARLVHRWLGHGIRNFEVEIGGEKTGYIDVMLILTVEETLIGFIGFWKGIKTNFTLVEGDLPLGEVEIADQDIPF